MRSLIIRFLRVGLRTAHPCVPATSKWAFYAPSMATPDLTTYAASKGYDVLTAINGGEGFWVNAKMAFTAQLPAGAVVSTSSYAIKRPRRTGCPWAGA